MLSRRGLSVFHADRQSRRGLSVFHTNRPSRRGAKRFSYRQAVPTGAKHLSYRQAFPAGDERLSYRQAFPAEINIPLTNRMSRQGHQEIDSRMHPSLEGSGCVRNEDRVEKMSERHLVTCAASIRKHFILQSVVSMNQRYVTGMSFRHFLDAYIPRMHPEPSRLGCIRLSIS